MTCSCGNCSKGIILIGLFELILFFVGINLTHYNHFFTPNQNTVHFYIVRLKNAQQFFSLSLELMLIFYGHIIGFVVSLLVLLAECRKNHRLFLPYLVFKLIYMFYLISCLVRIFMITVYVNHINITVLVGKLNAQLYGSTYVITSNC